MDPNAPLDRRQYIGTLQQRHKQLRRSYRTDIRDNIEVDDNDQRLLEMELLRRLVALLDEPIRR